MIDVRLTLITERSIGYAGLVRRGQGRPKAGYSGWEERVDVVVM